MLTDTEHDGRETVLLSLLVAAIVLVIAFVRQKTGAGARTSAQPFASGSRDETQAEVRA
jgi:GABA permease